MHSFENIFYNNYNDITKIMAFQFLKTGNPIYDAIFSTIIISIFGYFVNYIYENGLQKVLCLFSLYDIKSLFFKKNMIIIEGRRSSCTSVYCGSINVSSIYSDRFKAIWNYIITNIDNNKTIYSIKETHSNFQCSEQGSDKRKNMDIFMVCQIRHFIMDEHIFVKTETMSENDSDDKEKIKSKTDKIIIYLYSYVYSLSYLKNYIDNITEKYLSSIKQNRANKRFIYFLEKIKCDDEETKLNCWREDIFESPRTFQNIFFDGKKEMVEKIDFFLHNRHWYYEKGIPYSLGIGLHGPPGTGKTSFIKALANYTNRHLVVISLKMIKTKLQLEQFFFENRYNENNEPYDISFDKKIIVFEDIDCIGDIILDRNKKKYNVKRLQMPTKNVNVNVNVKDVLQKICDINDTNVPILSSQEDPITLDDILNLWDGIRETPGRILVISSNHYDTLDPALIRPGRIDITHELRNANRKTISEIYFHLFGTEINAKYLCKIKEYLYSPAELINMYVTCKTENAFIERIVQNKKI